MTFLDKYLTLLEPKAYLYHVKENFKQKLEDMEVCKASDRELLLLKKNKNWLNVEVTTQNNLTLINNPLEVLSYVEKAKKNKKQKNKQEKPKTILKKKKKAKVNLNYIPTGLSREELRQKFNSKLKELQKTNPTSLAKSIPIITSKFATSEKSIDNSKNDEKKAKFKKIAKNPKKMEVAMEEEKKEVIDDLIRRASGDKTVSFQQLVNKHKKKMKMKKQSAKKWEKREMFVEQEQQNRQLKRKANIDKRKEIKQKKKDKKGFL